MNLGAAVLTFREGLEAALIIAIVLGYLRKIDRSDRRPAVWLGAGVAFALTAGFIAVLQLIGAEFTYPAKGIYEGVTGLLAVAMVTYMTVWMTRQSRYIKHDLESGVQATLAAGSASLFTLVFLAVIREGIETGLFLSAATFASSGQATLFGGVAGLLLAAVAATAMYTFGVRLHLGRYFQIAGLLLVVFGAAILRYAVHEFEEVGFLPPLIERVWYTGKILPEGTGLGAVLQALIGYTSKPSLMQLLVYGGYYLIVGTVLYRVARRPVAPARPVATSAAMAQSKVTA